MCTGFFVFCRRTKNKRLGILLQSWPPPAMKLGFFMMRNRNKCLYPFGFLCTFALSIELIIAQMGHVGTPTYLPSVYSDLDLWTTVGCVMQNQVVGGLMSGNCFLDAGTHSEPASGAARLHTLN